MDRVSKRLIVAECLDGGGVRSYSSILIIKALMDQIRSLSGDRNDDQGNHSDPSPAQNLAVTYLLTKRILMIE